MGKLRLSEVNAFIKTMCVARQGIVLKVGISGSSLGLNCQDQHFFFFFLQLSWPIKYMYIYGEREREMETKYSMQTKLLF